jgi:hypothetical protein
VKGYHIENWPRGLAMKELPGLSVPRWQEIQSPSSSPVIASSDLTEILVIIPDTEERQQRVGYWNMKLIELR